MSTVIPTPIPVLTQSGGNVHGTVLAREFSSGTPRLRIAATRFKSATKTS